MTVFVRVRAETQTGWTKLDLRPGFLHGSSGDVVYLITLENETLVVVGLILARHFCYHTRKRDP